ncbi:MAG: hypothetical protein IIB45_10905, partial [Candidatus Marinimicrobia bacterium]|nr:hypothetical protein [Candidatus Neomarinimicrobiota bacterium]
MSDRCPICNSPTYGVGSGNYYINSSLYNCYRCGKYEIDSLLAESIRKDLHDSKKIANISGWIREHQREFVDEIRYGELLELKTPTVAEKAQKLLKYISTVIPKPGDKIDIDIGDMDEILDSINSGNIPDHALKIAKLHLPLLSASWSEHYPDYKFIIKVPSILPDGQWIPHLGIQMVSGGDLVETDWNGFIVIDSKPPDISFEPSPLYALEDGQPVLVNEPIEVVVKCVDDWEDDDGNIVEGSGCYQYEDVPLGEYPPFLVKGNFCDNDTKCDENGERDFMICDQAGNCQWFEDVFEAELLKELMIDHYDPVVPEFTGVELAIIDNGDTVRSCVRKLDGTETCNGGGIGDALEASVIFSFKIEGAEDPDTVDSLKVDPDA